MRRTLLITALSVCLSTCVFCNAFFQKKQFYPSIVYLTKSNSSTAILFVQAIVLIYLFGQFMSKLFFGQLRSTEVEHLIEKSWYAVTETCLAFTVFRDDFSSRFFFLFSLLLFLKCFHWLAEDRIDYMERSPLIGWLFHIRAFCLLSFLSIMDLIFVKYAYQATVSRGASVQLVFGFEYMILFAGIVGVWQKYILHTIDIQRGEPWDSKPMLILWGELFLSGARLLLYSVFILFMLRVHTLPLFAIRPAYAAFRAFRTAFADMVLSRRAIEIMQRRYPDATEEDLNTTDNVCIICREEMVPGACKKLPCSHIFHVNCLRSWFQRQQTCPTCRLDVLRNPAQPVAADAAAAAAPNPPSSPSSASSVPSSSSTAQSVPAAAFFIPKSSNSQVNLASFSAPPLITPDLKSLSDEELKQLEGWHREAVEKRVEHLQHISALLDAAVIHMQQYTTLMANMPPPPTPSSNVTFMAPASTVTKTETPVKKEPVDISSASASVVKSESGDTDEAASNKEKDISASESNGSLDQTEIRRRRLNYLSSQESSHKDEDGLD